MSRSFTMTRFTSNGRAARRHEILRSLLGVRAQVLGRAAQLEGLSAPWAGVELHLGSEHVSKWHGVWPPSDSLGQGSRGWCRSLGALY